MTYWDEWRALSARIKALGEASEAHARHMAVNSGDPYARARRILEQCQSVLNAARSFGEKYQRFLPAPVFAALSHLLDQTLPFVSDTTASTGTRQELASTAVTQLTLFDSEVSYLLTDTHASIRTRCERAFEHLRRLIVVDPAQKALWQAAYAQGEVACEKLGATHLLSHGIWTFKADAAGARTDLVYSEPIDLDRAARSADGLVLTEWKKAEKQATVLGIEGLFADARAQAKRYAEGPLAGFELTDYRYMIVVSWSDVEVPADVREEGVLYRQVNIPVDPATPSKPRRRP